MKILVTDIYFRKSFDTINILRKHFSKDKFIFTDQAISKFSKFKLKSIFGINDLELLRRESFEADLFKISKKFSQEQIIYIPIEESTTLKFLMFVESKGKCNFLYMLPSLSQFLLSSNKEKLNLFCQNHNISCPKYISKTELLNKDFEFPIIKKPIHGSGSKGIVYIENQAVLENCSINFDKEFIQERLPNSKDVEAGFFLCKAGEVISFYSHKRIRTYPDNGGVTVFSKAQDNKAIKSFGQQILKELNWSGLVMIEFIYDKRDGNYKLIEINPRLWGSILLSEFCNANFLKNYVNGAVENMIEKIPEINTNVYIRWVFPYDFIYWFKHISNPFKFFRKYKNTCYINFSYSSLSKSLLFILFSYFDFKKL